MLDKQQKKAKQAKPIRDPKAEYEASMYHPNGDPNRHGFPAAAFRLAMTAAVRRVDGVTMTSLRGVFCVVGDDDNLVEIIGKPQMREDMVRVGGKGKGTGTADLRFRAGYRKWSAKVTIKYLASVVSAEQLANLLELAGGTVGIGKWRPEKDGDFGTFTITAKGKA